MDDDDGRFFRSDGPDWRNKAMLMHGFGDRWYLYGEGYREAADRLVLDIESGGGQQDFLIYPILFLYRHYLEVTIKGQIRAAQRLLGIEPPKKPNRKDRAQMAAAAQGHDLEALWDYLLARVYELHRDQDPALMGRMTVAISAFHTLDKGGDATRYPEGLDGKPTLLALDAVNLRQLREDLGLAHEALTQVNGILDYEGELLQLTYEASDPY